MTITRLWQAGAEWQDVLLEFSSRDDPLFAISATEKRTGGYAVRTEDKHYGQVDLGTTYAQLRIGIWVKHSGVVSGQSPRLISLRDSTDGDADVLQVRWDGDNSEFKIYSGVGGTLLGSAVSSTFAAGGWIHVGLDIKFHASAGWAYLYINETQIIGFDGDTTQLGTQADTVLVGGVQTANNQWNQYLYLDDLYIDSTVGESAPAIVPKCRFDPLTPTGEGVHADWVGSDGNSTDNWQLVDDRPPDDDTTYIQGETVATTDSSAMSDWTPIADWLPNAVIPMSISKKGPGSTLEQKLYTRTIVDGSPFWAWSASMPVAETYGLLWERRALRPDNGDWDVDTVNALEIGVEAS